MDPALKDKLFHAGRNNKLFDLWSIVHFLTGVAAAWVMPPVIALLILVLWEPLEILVLSPLFARIGIEFGYESLRNSMSDIVFDCAGVAVGAFVVAKLWDPPFTLF